MEVSYNRLWKQMIDKRMKKSDLMRVADISTATVAKMSKEKPISIEVLGRICIALSCDIGEVIEIILPERKDGDFNIDD